MGTMIRRSALWIVSASALSVAFATACKKENAASSSSGGTTAQGVASAIASSVAQNSPLGTAAGAFDGEMVLLSAPVKNKKDKAFDITLFIKKDKVRVDAPAEMLKEAGKFTGGGGVYMLVHGGDKKAWAVIDGQKKAILFDMDKSADEIRGMASGARPGMPPGKTETKPPPKITRTGKKAKVAGYDCEDWEISSQDPKEPGKAVICVADMETSWLKLPTKILPDQFGLFADLIDGKHLPVRLIAYDKDGESLRVEVQKLDKKAVPDEKLTVPPGYQVTDMMTFISAMMGGGRPGMPGAMPPGMPPGAMPPGAMPAGGMKPPAPQKTH